MVFGPFQIPFFEAMSQERPQTQSIENLTNINVCQQLWCSIDVAWLEQLFPSFITLRFCGVQMIRCTTSNCKTRPDVDQLCFLFFVFCCLCVTKRVVLVQRKKIIWKGFLWADLFCGTTTFEIPFSFFLFLGLVCGCVWWW